MTQDNLSDEERREILVRNWEEKAHEALRAAKEMVKKNRLDASWGKLFDWLFENRHRADYESFTRFDPPVVSEMIDQASAFVSEMERLVKI